MRKIILTLGFMALLSSEAVAATILLQTSAGLRDTALPPANGGELVDIETLSFDTVGSVPFRADDARVESPNAFASSLASANVATGLLRSLSIANSQDDIDSPIGFLTESSSSANAIVTSIFDVSGVGTITANLDYDGFFNINQRGRGAIGFQAQARITFNEFSRLRVEDRFSISSGDFELASSLLGDERGTLSISTNVRDGQRVSLTTQLLTQILSGNGVVDFSNTAALSLFASPGVTLSFADDRFLSVDPNAVAAVPLPAAFPLMAGGVGLLGLAGYRRKKKVGSFISHN